MPRDNLLNSACLELFEFIRRENIKLLVIHLVETYRARLAAITYVDTFQSLILRYDQMHEPVTTQELENSFTTVESDTPVRNANMTNGRWSQALKDDVDEEAYFNGSDGEEDTLPNPVKPINGASPVRPLVNYPDDEGEDDGMDILTTSPATVPLNTNTTQDSDALPNPPERLSEKRRREDDEEDELAKISSQNTKRRSSTSSNASNSSVQRLRRKNSINAGKDGGAPKKMSISIGVKSGGEGTSEGD